MSNTISSLVSNNYVSRNAATKKVPLSDELMDYLDNSGNEGKKLSKIIKKLVSDSNGDLTDGDNLSEISKKGKEFIKSYNKIVDYCRKNSDDEELKKLTRTLTNLTSQKKSEFSSLGISVQSFGRLKITDSILYSNSVNNKNFSKFITANSGNFTKTFDKINKIARSLEKDNTSFLDSNTLKKMNDYFWKSGSQTQSISSQSEANDNYNIPGSTFSNYA